MIQDLMFNGMKKACSFIMKKFLLIPIAVMGYHIMISTNLQHVDSSEFRGFDLFLSAGLMQRYDIFKGSLDGGCMISPARHSILRFDLDLKKTTDHYLGRALDVMITGDFTLRECYHKAVDSGFNAIGIYPFWKPYKGLHLAIRFPLTTTRLYRWSDLSRIPGKHDYKYYEKGFIYDE